MRLSIVYGFENAPIANRFLNDVNSNATLAHAKAKLFDRDKVRISYVTQQHTYDDTLSFLDNLSGQYGGYEIDS
jgi:hypothetical protein